MAVEINKYGGLVPDLKKDFVDITKIANIKDKNLNAVTSTFRINSPVIINEGANSIGDCNSIPANCNIADGFSVTADHTISTNEKYTDCVAKLMTEEEKLQEMNSVAKSWSLKEATYIFKELKTQMGTNDLTSEVTDEMNIRDEILLINKKLVDNGYSPSDIVIAINTDVYYELTSLDMNCCDFNIQNSVTGSIISNKLGVNLVYVPNAVLGDGIRVMGYIKEYALFKVFCKEEVKMRDIQDVDYADTIMQIIGKETVKISLYDAENSGYYITEVVPAP